MLNKYPDYSKIVFLVILSLSFSYFGCSRGINVANINSQGETIICFGDSITEGPGVQEPNNYPSLLSKKLGLEVINAGISGDTTRGALGRIKSDVLDLNPKLVIVEFGANDFFRKIPTEETFKNLEEIVAKIQDKGAIVVIVCVKMGLMSDIYYKDYKRIAKKRRALIIPDIMKGIINNTKLKVDQLHPNKDGYEIIAERIYNEIKHLLKE